MKFTEKKKKKKKGDDEIIDANAKVSPSFGRVPQREKRTVTVTPVTQGTK